MKIFFVIICLMLISQSGHAEEKAAKAADQKKEHAESKKEKLSRGKTP